MAIPWLSATTGRCSWRVAGWRWIVSTLSRCGTRPLLRATIPGRPDQFSHMGIKPGSTYAHVPKALMKAWEKNVKEGVVDTELDLEGLDKPKFGHHANRRKSDKVANDTKEATGVTEEEIDDHFGWDQKSRTKKSRLHYKGRTARLRRARVTSQL